MILSAIKAIYYLHLHVYNGTYKKTPNILRVIQLNKKDQKNL